MKKIISILLWIIAPVAVYAAFSTDTFQPQAVYSGINATSSPLSSITLIGSDVLGYSTLLINPTVSSSTVTLPASSTLASMLTYPGLRLSMFVFNASSTPGITLTILGNAANGSVLENSSSTATINSLRGAVLEVMRKSASSTNPTISGDFLWTLIPAI